MSYLKEHMNGNTGQRFELFNLVYNTNSFYRKKFDDAGLNPDNLFSKDSFNKVPYTHKHEIINNPYILSTVPKKWLSEIGISTGTTGEDQLYIPYSFNDLYKSGINDFFCSSLSIKDIIPIKQQDVVINILPYEVTQVGLTIHRLLQDKFGAGVIPAGKGGFYSKIDKILEVMCQKKPDCMVTSPSYAVQLAEHALENNINPDDIDLRFIWLVGEPCSGNLKKRIARLWSAQVQIRYGTLECGAIGFQCGLSNYYHVADNHCYVEIDEDSKFVNGAGEIVVTVFWRKSSPLIRFRTGDYGKLLNTQCECGARTPILEIIGRKQSILHVSGKHIPLIDLEDRLLSYSEVGNWYQVKLDNSGIKIFAEPPFGEKADNAKKQKIENEMKDQFECNFDLKFVDRTPRFSGKAERIIHH